MCVRYTLENSAHLRAAVELDIALREFSLRLHRKELCSNFGCTDSINNDEDLQRVMHALRETTLKPFHFFEWFVIEPDSLFLAWERQLCSVKTLNPQHTPQTLIKTKEEKLDTLVQAVRYKYKHTISVYTRGLQLGFTIRV